MAKNNKSLVLRSCNEDMSSTNSFVWPGVGEVAEAPDWQPTNECGAGLHGWLFGQGDHQVSKYLNSTAKWLVVEVESSDIIMLGGKCKFPRGKVLFVGSKKDATDYLIEHEPRTREVAVIGAHLTVGDKQSVTVGALGTATAGDSCCATRATPIWRAASCAKDRHATRLITCASCRKAAHSYSRRQSHI